jgi:hypothetical protein
LCEARNYEALKAGRMSSGSSALCSMLIRDQARGKLGYVISLSGPECWEGVSAKAQTSSRESANGPENAVPVLIHRIAAMNLVSSGWRFIQDFKNTLNLISHHDSCQQLSQTGHDL